MGEILYLAYLVLMMGARTIGLYEGMTVYTVILVISALIYLCKIVVTPHTVTEYAVTVLLMAVAGLVYLHTGEKGLIICFMTMSGMKYVDKNRVLRYGTVTAAVCIMFRILTGVSGILPEKYYPQYREGVGLMFRHALGYAHPNTLHMNVLLLSMLTLYLMTSYLSKVCREDNELYGRCFVFLAAASAILLGFNMYIFMYSGSRAGVMAYMAYMIVNIWFFAARSPKPFESIVCYMAYPAVCFITIVMPFILPGSIFDKVNRTVFNTRYSIAKYFWSNNGLSLWGIRLNNPDIRYKTYGIDMSYMYLFLQLGIVAFVLISVITIMYVREALKRSYMTELAVLMGTLFVGIWEPFLYNAGFKNFTFVFMGAMMYEVLEERCSSKTGIVQEKEKADTHMDKAVGLITGLTAKKMLVFAATVVVCGLAASTVYLAVTEIPSALYADRQEDEAGEEFGMEPVYLTEDEANAHESAGDLVVGYRDVNTPMYIYDTDIALMEYQKKVISIGVWIAVLSAAVMAFIYMKKV